LAVGCTTTLFLEKERKEKRRKEFYRVMFSALGGIKVKLNL